MSRRVEKTPLRPAYWKPWSPLFEELFDMPGSDWVRPAEVHVRPTRTGFTVTARFVLPSGLPATAVARVKITGSSATVDRETLRFRMRTRSAGSGAARDGRAADDGGSLGEHACLSSEVRR